LLLLQLLQLLQALQLRTQSTRWIVHGWSAGRPAEKSTGSHAQDQGKGVCAEPKTQFLLVEWFCLRVN
jgi:hypothetical protein